MRIDLPQNVNFIIDTLYEHGFEAYAVGGCVRDSLLGRTPQDWDITTSAKPAQVKAIFDPYDRHRYPAWHSHGHAGACGL